MGFRIKASCQSALYAPTIHANSTHLEEFRILTLLFVEITVNMSLNTGDKNAKITVLLVTPSNDMIVDRLEMQLKDGLLPIRELKKTWNAKVGTL